MYVKGKSFLMLIYWDYVPVILGPCLTYLRYHCFVGVWNGLHLHWITNMPKRRRLYWDFSKNGLWLHILGSCRALHCLHSFINWLPVYLSISSTESWKNLSIVMLWLWNLAWSLGHNYEKFKHCCWLRILRC